MQMDNPTRKLTCDKEHADLRHDVNVSDARQRRKLKNGHCKAARLDQLLLMTATEMTQNISSELSVEIATPVKRREWVEW